jgi:asparagine synthase (glutamine-hydrolysing)
MCGIAGVVRFKGAGLESLAWQSAFQRLEHRGPDGQGFLGFRVGSEIEVALNGLPSGANGLLLHRRLSILDLSAAGAQPMASRDGRFWLTFNGEVYNFLELRADLETAGYQFQSHSDTEVILAALDHWGHAAVSRFVGMFAMGVLDRKTRRLTLYRDQFGIKPLYVYQDATRLTFASEMKALFPLAEIKKEIEPQSLYRYLRFGYTDEGESTLIRGVRHLPPGSYLEVSLDTGESVLEQFWKLQVAATADVSFEQATQAVRDMFLKNVELHLRSDVPVGACLSGGLDSSAIVSAMRHLKGDSLEIHTFTYLAEGSLSEEKWADRVSNTHGTISHKIRPAAEDLATELDEMIAAQDEPFVSTSMYAQYRVFRLIREHRIKVVLDGQGADETFAGYRPFFGPRIAELLRRGKVGEARHLWGSVAGEPGFENLRYFVGKELLPEFLQGGARKLIGKDYAPAWLNARWFQDRSVTFNNGASNGRSLQEQLADSTRCGLRSLLRYEDRNSMAHSIESRVPFLTPALVEFVLTLPSEYLISCDGVSKSVLRAAMRGIVPDDVLDRRDKVAFVTPEKDWLVRLGGWVEETLTSERARSVPALNTAEMLREWKDVSSGRASYNMWTWRWINLIRWAGLNDVQFS